MAHVQRFFLTQSMFREKKLSKRLTVGFKCERKCHKDLHVEENGEKKKLKILIAGGGIGGLVFALAAKKSGFDVKVFEKDLTAVRGEGRKRGPIQLLSCALGLLESIDKDVATELMEVGYVTGNRVNGVADGLTGEWFGKFDFLSPALEKRIPVTQLVCRVDLQRLLLNAVGEDIVINSSKVVDFESNASRVTVILENGQKHEGDILVGADGIRSRVRTRLFGGREPKYSNFVCYTGVAEVQPQNYSNLGYKIFIGTNQYFVMLGIGTGRMQWYAFVRSPPETAATPSKESKNMLVKSFGDWSNEVISIINRTSETTIIERPIYDIDMTNIWGKGRVVLLGDAAHAMLPNLGQGGSMAIEDSYWLMLELQDLVQRRPISEIPLDELELAFKRFEKKRMFRVRTLHSVCRLASVMTSFYQTYVDIGPFPAFNLPSVRLKHPAFIISSKLMQWALPIFMDWVVAGPE